MHANVQLYEDFFLRVESFSIATCKGENKCITNNVPGCFVCGNQMGHTGSGGYIIQKAVPTVKGKYPHSKEKLFASWGYTVEDARWLQTEMERQAREKYVSGNYVLGKLNRDGQRISIRIEIPRKNGVGTVSFLSGWMVYPNGRLRLTTPYGGK